MASDPDGNATAAIWELLAIIGESRHERDRKQVVLLDLKRGQIHRSRPSFIRTRRKLKTVLEMGRLIERQDGKAAGREEDVVTERVGAG